MNETVESPEKFVWWKFFSLKALSPLIAMFLWAFLIYSKALVGDYMVFGVGVGLLLFSGILSAQSVLKVLAEKWKVKNEPIQ